MREYRISVYQVETVVDIWQWRRERTDLEMSTAQVFGAPLDVIGIDIDAVQLNVRIMREKVTRDAPASYAKIKNSFHAFSWKAVTSCEVADCLIMSSPEEDEACPV